MSRAAAQIQIQGRVQGVGFRYSLKRTADSYQLCGWCRNTPDGKVEALLCGEKSAVAAVIDWCRQGPALAAVSHIEINWQNDQQCPSGFTILR